MRNISSITHYPLKIIFAVHFSIYTCYSVIFFVCLLWAINNAESDEPIQFALFVNVLSILFDIVTLSVYFPKGYAWDKFTAAVLIVNLIARVVSSYSLLRIGQARGGMLASLLTPSPAMGL